MKAKETASRIATAGTGVIARPRDAICFRLGDERARGKGNPKRGEAMGGAQRLGPEAGVG